MKRRFPALFFAIPATALLALLWACDGGGGNGVEDADVVTDRVDEGIIDVVTDEDDGVTDPVPDQEDVLPDVLEDTPEDVIVDVVDVEEEEAVSPGEPQPYQCETAGGAILTSDNYRLEVFVAPVRPIGNLSSTNYSLKLGPAGLRSPH